jgi:DHA3 family macrolide efflux protein-like MFS transporter
VGPFIDRWDRRLTMITADLCIAATSVVILVVFYYGGLSLGAVIGVITLRSVGAAFHTPASQAAVPMYVPAEHLMRVAGWNFFLGSGVAMVSPVLGAFVMGIAPMSAVIALDVAGAAIAVVSLLLVRIPHPQAPAVTGKRAEHTRLVAEFLDGWHELVRHRGLLELTLLLAVITLVYMPLNALFPLMTLEHFGGDAVHWSVTEFAFGGGMVVGSAGMGVMSSRFSGVRLIGTGILLEGVTLGVSGLLPSSSFWVFAALCALMGAAVPVFAAPITAMFQRMVEPSRLGRVLALYTTICMIVSPVGLLLAGPLAQMMGVAVWFAISGLVILLVGMLGWALPAVRRLGRDDMPVGGATMSVADPTAEIGVLPEFEPSGE